MADVLLFKGFTNKSLRKLVGKQQLSVCVNTHQFQIVRQTRRKLLRELQEFKSFGEFKSLITSDVLYSSYPINISIGI